MKREKKYDILKIIGLLAIVLAHVNPNQVVFQIRNFDVVLLLIISCYLGIKSYSNGNVFKYVKKRFCRLVVPTWIFLILFFILNIFLNLCDVNIKKIIGSFTLQGGIGYVWVIRIYFLIALLIPIFIHFYNKNKTKTYISTVILYIIYELLFNYGFFSNTYIEYFFAYIAPCALLLTVSCLIFDENKRNLNIVLTISGIIYIGLAIYLYKKNGIFISTQEMKYPFRIYYLSFGVFITSFLVKLFNTININNIKSKIAQTVISNSLWFYLWHIIFIYMLLNIEMNWMLKYLIVLVATFTVIFIQSKFTTKMKGKIPNYILNLFKG